MGGDEVMMARLYAAFLTILLLLSAVPEVRAYPANQCAADRFGSDLNCTANDVSITGISVVGDTTSCVGGTNITLDLQMTINFATPDRYDVGIFISNDGKTPQARSTNGGASSCSVSVLPTASPFLDLDGASTGDTCGDGNGTIGGGTGSGIHYMTNVTVPCQSLSGAGGNLYIPFVVSWDNQASPAGGMCTSNLDPVPNTSSKCNSPTVVQGSVAVAVLPAITKSDGVSTIFSGSTTNYTITVTNTTGVSLGGAVFKDPAVSGIAANSVTCAAAGGASCPASSTVSAMQGSGIAIPTMPIGGSVTFTVNATLTGTPGATRTNTASVTVGSQSNSASDTDTIVGSIAILPTTLSQNGDKGAGVVYTYTVYNFGPSVDTISLSAASSLGWSVSRSPTSVTIPANGSATVTVTVNIPTGASLGTVDTTTLTAVSGVNPSKTATATAVTTVTAVLTLIPSNTGAGGAGSAVYYTHRVQNNASTAKSVSLTPSFTGGTCTGWTTGLYQTDKTTTLTSPVSITANGGYKDFVLKGNIPTGASLGSICTVTLSAAYTSGSPSTVSVTDVTSVKNLVLYEDPGYTTEQNTYPVENNVYAKSYGLTNGTPYYYKWLDPTGAVMRTSPITGNLVSLPDTYTIPTAGPLGTWTVQLWNNSTNTIFEQTNFYVGPDHLKAGYTGSNPGTGTNVVVDLALHDKLNHVVPKDAFGNLVRGSPTDIEGPLMITVTVSGSASIVSTTLTNAVITGQSVTGKLDSTTGTATLTISDSVVETVTITPSSYKGALYGSPARDESASVTFIESLNHIRFEHAGTGVTCLASPVTIKACADAACTTLSPSAVTASLSPASGWSVNPVTFTGSTTITLSKTTPQTVPLATGAVSPIPSGTSPQCYVGGTPNCNLVFADTGFIFSDAAGGSALTIPAQTAGISSNTYYLRAVKKSTTTKACESALAGTTPVSFAYECNNPTTCSTLDYMSINGGASTAITRNNNGSVSSYQPVGMTFDVNGNAPFTLNYGDVGQVTLYAQKSAGGALLATLAGVSNAFVVKPAGFVLSGIKQTAAPQLANPAAADAAGAKFMRAGEAFTVTVTSVDANGNATPNYGREIANESVRLSNPTANLVAPVGGFNPAVTGAFGSFGNGSATGTDFKWSEVGIIKLTPSVFDGDYLGAGDVTGTASGNIGRFYPAQFTLSQVGTDALLVPRSELSNAAINSGIGTNPISTFAYLGEPLQAKFRLTAQNADGATTQNYTGSLAKLGLGAAANLNFGVYQGSTNLLPNLTSTCGATCGSWGSGVADITAILSVSRAAGFGPFETAVFGTSLIDSDGVTLATLNFDRDLNGVNDGGQLGTVALRYGRIRLQNAHGSELLPLPVPMTVEYCKVASGTSCAIWAVNTDDDATLVAVPTSSSGLGIHLQSGGTTTASINGTSSGSGTVLDGNGNLRLSAPGSGKTGYVDITLDAPDWLDFNWKGAGSANPSARATFGVYKNVNEFIYMRENY